MCVGGRWGRLIVLSRDVTGYTVLDIRNIGLVAVRVIGVRTLDGDFLVHFHGPPMDF